MKIWQRFIAFLIAVGLCVGMFVGVAKILPAAEPEDEPIELHLIRNADGSYGGSYAVMKYGEGAPLNGEYDVPNSDYYTVNNDYYNMTSTSERLVIPHFSSYQQTMADSSGIACLMMLLNYAGEDVYNTYTELALVKRYEELVGKTVYGNGTSEAGLKKLIEDLDLGYTVDNTSFKLPSSEKEEATKNFLMESLAEGKFVFVRYQSPMGYGWKLVIGYDTLGQVQNTYTDELQESLGDDVIIFAEPNDGYDHFQDGYATERAKDFAVWWKCMKTNGKVTDTCSYLIVDPNLDIEYDLQPVEEETKQKLYDIHLPLNPDGSYGCTRNWDLYGSIISGKGYYNHTNSNYYKINDFYNMESTETRILLSGYTVLQQTMHSSCGICAINSVMKYYGYGEESYYDLELSYLNLYESINASEGAVKGRGTNVRGHANVLTALGYEVDYYVTDKGNTPEFDTYEKYMSFIRKNLVAGRPVVVSTNLGSGHYLTVIGMDDMGTEYTYDDVIITADSSDYWDGYQDGYNVFSARKFYSQHTNGSGTRLQSIFVVYPK